LESLGLLRHCQNDILLELILRHKDSFPRYKASFEQLQKLAQVQFKNKKIETASINSFSKHLKGKSLWRVKRDQLLKSHPSALKIKLQNRCES